MNIFAILLCIAPIWASVSSANAPLSQSTSAAGTLLTASRPQEIITSSSSVSAIALTSTLEHTLRVFTVPPGSTLLPWTEDAVTCSLSATPYSATVATSWPLTCAVWSYDAQGVQVPQIGSQHTTIPLFTAHISTQGFSSTTTTSSASDSSSGWDELRAQWENLSLEWEDPSEQRLAEESQVQLESAYASRRIWQESMLYLPPATAREVMDGELDRHFPGLNAPRTLKSSDQLFRREMARPMSRLYLRIFAFIGSNVLLRPELSLEQLITLALLHREDRTADIAEMTRWIESVYPWFASNRRFEDGTTGQLTTLNEHIHTYFQRSYWHTDNTFLTVDPATRGRGDIYEYYSGSNVRYLPPGAENQIFLEFFDQPNHATNQPLPRTPGVDSATVISMPEEILLEVFRYLLVYSGSIYVIPSVRFNVGQRYFVDYPAWTAPATGTNYVGLGELSIETPEWIPARWIEMNQSLFLIRPFRDLACRTFFGLNTFTIMPDRPDYPGHPTKWEFAMQDCLPRLGGFFTEQWLNSLGNTNLGFLRRITIYLHFNDRQRRRIGALLLRLSNNAHPPQITLVIDTVLLTSTYPNPEIIPGMAVLRRFRHLHHIIVIVDGHRLPRLTQSP
ncbi:hypothetical protein CC86DRAFT_388721 [Ophiobolus disseminans]|uniref:Ig-like domain-containing protein n=1 Tax=Ophiobolus disseminans TaxID=1469910 RepID=A0A6A6ZCG7_9PLEO|nr:hypothetical protein CC86DRAFT_388721 [Ophiobolus disseminans]